MNLINKFLVDNKIKYRNINLYIEALTHSSFTNENKGTTNYQRLEFLGDAILDFLSSEFMINNFPNLSEGEMSIRRASAVKGEKLAYFSKQVGLNKIIRVGKNKKDFKNGTKIYADVFESFIAAIYIDLGLEEVKTFLKNNVFQFLLETQNKEMKNPKTLLQEFMQLESRGTLKYITHEVNRNFVSEVYHDETKFSQGKGSSKKEAEVNAAKKALSILKGYK